MPVRVEPRICICQVLAEEKCDGHWLIKLQVLQPPSAEGKNKGPQFQKARKLALKSVLPWSDMGWILPLCCLHASSHPLIYHLSSLNVWLILVVCMRTTGLRGELAISSLRLGFPPSSCCWHLRQGNASFSRVRHCPFTPQMARTRNRSQKGFSMFCHILLSWPLLQQEGRQPMKARWPCHECTFALPECTGLVPPRGTHSPN